MSLIGYVNVITGLPVIRNWIDETAIGYKAIFKTQKNSPQYKKFFRVNFGNIKKFVYAQFRVLKNRWGFLPSKISHFSGLKKRLNFYIFFL